MLMINLTNRIDESDKTNNPTKVTSLASQIGFTLLVMMFILLLSALVFADATSDLISSYNYTIDYGVLNLTSRSDGMFSMGGGALNDTLILSFNYSAVQSDMFTFIFRLNDLPNVFMKEVNKTFSVGQNALNVSFDTLDFQGGSFNYTILAINSTGTIVYQSDQIPTNTYSYKKRLTVIGISDYAQGTDGIWINITLNTTNETTKNITLTLSSNGTTLTKSQTATLPNGTSYISIFIDNETIKRSHINNPFNLTLLAIGNLVTGGNKTTQSYNFESFAKTSYLKKVDSVLIDQDSDNLTDKMMINITFNIILGGDYNVSFIILDLEGNLLKSVNEQSSFSTGIQNKLYEINGTDVYTSRLNGPFAVKNVFLSQGNQTIDSLTQPALTNTTLYTDFTPPPRPNLRVNISVTYNSSQPNVTNYTLLVTNEGNVSAFDFLVDVEGNDTYNYTSYIPFLAGKNSSIIQQSRENDSIHGRYTAFVDFTNNVDEYNKSDNIASNIRTIMNISSVSALSTNGTQAVYEVVIKNIGDITLDNVTWRVEYGDNSNDSSIFNVTLIAGQSVFVFLEHNYAQVGSYQVLAVTQSNGVNNSATVSQNIGNGLQISNLSVISNYLFNATIEMIITNPTNQTRTANTWGLDAGDTTEASTLGFNLSSGKSIMVFIEHNYSQFGRFTPVATVNTNEDSKTTLARISEFIITNLTSLVESGLNRTFEVIVQNVWNVPASGNWSLNTGTDTYHSNQQFTLNSSKNISIFVEHVYPSSQNRTITAFVNTNQSNDTLTINI